MMRVDIDVNYGDKTMEMTQSGRDTGLQAEQVAVNILDQVYMRARASLISEMGERGEQVPLVILCPPENIPAVMTALGKPIGGEAPKR